jgi:DNA-binding response OmpR family regulator
MNESGLPRILVVEDETLILLETETVLRDAGFGVATAALGQSALAELENGQISGLITDVNLGRIDIQRNQIIAAARWTTPVKWIVRRS